jgi:BON domain
MSHEHSHRNLGMDALKADLLKSWAIRLRLSGPRRIRGLTMHQATDCFRIWLLRLTVCGLALAWPAFGHAQTRTGGGISSVGGASGGLSGGLSGSSSMGSSTGIGAGLSGTYFGSGGNSTSGGLGSTSSGLGGSSGFGSTSGSTSTGISTANPFYSYYATPTAFGINSSSGFASSTTNTLAQVANGTSTLSSTKPTAAFGQPEYKNTTGTSTTGAFGSAGTAFSRTGPGGFGGAPMGGTGTSTPTATTSAPTPPRFVTTIGFSYQPMVASQVQVDAQRTLANITSLDPNRNINVALVNGALVLRGTVANDDDRRVAEAIVRMMPGVHDVVNELQSRTAMVQTGQPPQ